VRVVTGILAEERMQIGFRHIEFFANAEVGRVYDAAPVVTVLGRECLILYFGFLFAVELECTTGTWSVPGGVSVLGWMTGSNLLTIPLI
jgi:hypothetical protein